MNAVDLMFIALLLGGLALGFFQGTIRLLVAIVALYVSIVLASLYFQIVGNWMRVRFGTTQDAAQTIAFAVILLVGFLLLTLAGLYTFRYARMPMSLAFVDRVIGTLLGLMLSALILGMFALVLRDLFILQSPARSASLPVTVWFQGSARSSILLPFFASNILPIVYASLRPFLPAEASLIFRA